MSKVNVLLLFGGESPEHEVSIQSAKNVFTALNQDRFNVTLGYIDKTGKWWQVQTIESALESKSHPKLGPILGEGTLLVWPSGRLIKPDVVLPVLHGPNGEDGTIQGLVKLLHIPIVGPSVLGATIGMDKEIAKRLLKEANIPVADWILYRTYDELLTYRHITEKLGKTLFVKPASQGSSVGVSRVVNEEQFNKALKLAAEYENKILIEKAIIGRELEVAVMSNKTPQATHAGEVTSGAEFYSYDAKYSASSKAHVIIPANISEETHNRLRDMAIEVYKVLECRGLARVDFFLTDSGDIYVNEINTLPGFTDISMYPKLWEAEGVIYSELIEKLIDFALEKQQ